MTSTITEAPASCYTVHDAEGLEALPSGVKVRFPKGSRAWPLDEFDRRTRFARYLRAGTHEFFEIMNPEILGNELPETTPSLEELIGEAARDVFAAIAAEGAARLAEAVLAVLKADELKPEVEWFDSPQVGDRVNVVYGGEWVGPGTVTDLPNPDHDYVTWVCVKLDSGLHGGFERAQVEPLLEAVDVKVVEDPEPRVTLRAGRQVRLKTNYGQFQVRGVGVVAVDFREGDMYLEVTHPTAGGHSMFSRRVEVVEPEAGDRVLLDRLPAGDDYDEIRGEVGTIVNKGSVYWRVLVPGSSGRVHGVWPLKASEFTVVIG